MAQVAHAVVRALGNQTAAPHIEVLDIGPNLKLYGAWQLALQVETEYVAIYDDDQIPGPTHLAALVKAVQTTGGITGMTGNE